MSYRELTAEDLRDCKRYGCEGTHKMAVPSTPRRRASSTLDIDRLARALDAYDDGCCIHDAHEAAVEVARLYSEDRK